MDNVGINNDVVLLIVFYNPNRKQIENAKSLGRMYHVVVVDNSDTILSDFKCENNIEYVPLQNNKGIAYAQNVGIKHAFNNKVRFILFLDQDSSFKEEDLPLMIAEYTSIKLLDPDICALGPLIINETTGREYKSELSAGDYGIVTSIISSGMLAEVSVLKEIGGMDEALFIDNVDHEWCWRANSKGKHVYMTRNVRLYHSVGQNTTRFLGMQIIKSSPTRSYYKFRNNILLLRREYVPFSWKIKSLLHMLFDYSMYWLRYKDYGKEYIKAANNGIKEAI